MSIFYTENLDTYLLSQVADTDTFRALSFCNRYYYGLTANYLAIFRTFYNDVKNDKKSGKWCINKLFMRACKVGDINLIKHIYTKYNPNIYIKNNKSFKIACKYGHVTIVKWFLDNFTIDANMDGEYAFVWACSNGFLDVAKLLVSRTNVNMDVITEKDNWKWMNDVYCFDEHGSSITDIITFRGHLHILQWFYDNKYCDFQNSIFEMLQTCLHVPYFDVALWLINTFNINIIELKKIFPYFTYDQSKMNLVVKFLISINKINITRDFFITLFISDEQVEIIKSLIDVYPEMVLKWCDNIAFYIACGKGSIEIAKLLLTIGNIDTMANNNYAFWLACYTQNIDIAKWLYAMNPNVARQNNNGSFNIDTNLFPSEIFWFDCETDKNLIVEYLNMLPKSDIGQWLYSVGYDFPKVDNINIHAFKLDILEWLYSINKMSIEDMIKLIGPAMCVLKCDIINELLWLLEKRPDNREIYNQLCISYFYKGDIEAALNITNKYKVNYDEVINHYDDVLNLRIDGNYAIISVIFMNACSVGNKEVIMWLMRNHKINNHTLNIGVSHSWNHLTRWFIDTIGLSSDITNNIIDKLNSYAGYEPLDYESVSLYEYITNKPYPHENEWTNENESGFMMACKTGLLDTVKSGMIFDRDIMNGVKILCRKGCIEILEWVLEKKQYELNYADMLIETCKHDKLETFQWICNKFNCLNEDIINEIIKECGKRKAFSILKYIKSLTI